MVVVAKKWVLKKNFIGEPKDDDLVLEEEQLPALKDGDVLFEALWLSVDPYMRPYSNNLKAPVDMIGQQLARVVESKDGRYPIGSRYLGDFGWRTHTIFNPKAMEGVKGTYGKDLVIPCPDLAGNPESYSLGCLGMPGATAYFGLLKVCDPKPGDTVLVNAAAGAVGSMVGQIAKIKGCKTIGYAGTEQKVKWLKEIGYDFAFNYKTEDVSATLSKAAPEGINCYFDNASSEHEGVGGDFSNTVITKHMSIGGRIAICGAISSYNATAPPMGPELYGTMIFKQLKMQGFIVYQYYSEYHAAVKELAQWIKEGKIQVCEDVTDGFANMRSGFYGLLKGKNTGKAVIKA
ncbi:hypothetical protein CAPTEDRAFT_19977 [Capitella teleta]|uniref:Prostaglandin reductase 1 n=1 Tax=Capitella teleta TaxID=283909 RepID=R7TRG2_CAPTE|nr:hypothetical protein CAPTEDRAFT_19977 [Capitella teleta]|eukprot:ELT96229.1 hypothetical protein CAPTEDRAFT_19977 [Capitella teleta]